MNGVYRATSFADFSAVCMAGFLGLIVCLTLIGCGNKGDLYLENVELTAEQKALLNPGEAVDEVDQVDELDEITDPEKPKKKKTDESQSTE